ncbi:cytochrome c oxidase assembly protein [Micromonospora polyrhachis]|uniref:Cytochrome c oxidase assembly factor CtaG n=1 Tax=Micromonospora polyrhachis TaxID=1282883 RepID=A0A7W7SWZ2_9ACTN|nr:cytochrome c oxidase assembly protein [Micromonospora polyrhachis]MBB4962530.1 cytochrome c oxidase assembly factor CtaG [Micromonospora polyrhachis]
MPALTLLTGEFVPLAHGGTDGTGLSGVVLVVSTAGLLATYGRGVHELWLRRGIGAVVPAWRVVSFVTGIVALGATQTGPLHTMAERSFAGHMAQHMVLLLMVGPLLAAGAAGLPFALAGPRWLRRRWARWRVGAIGRWLRRPLVLATVAGTTQSLVLWLWHLPAPYRAVLRDDALHAVQHTTFVAAAWLLWSTVWGAQRHRLPGPVGILLLFLTMLPASALAAALTFAPEPLYPTGTQTTADRLATTTPDALADQQWGGLVMWIPMDVAVLVAAVILVLRWFGRLDRRTPAGRDLMPPESSDPTPPDERDRVTRKVTR